MSFLKPSILSIAIFSAFTGGACEVFKDSFEGTPYKPPRADCIKNHAPVFTNTAASVNVAENSTAVGTYSATDVDAGDVISYALIGDDASKFSTDATGKVTFNTAPDYETPTDTDSNNRYQLTITATDKAGLTDTQSITVNVTNVNEAPVFSNTVVSVDVAENSTVVGTYSATDVDAGDVISYALSGDDASQFSIDATGKVTFKTAPDYETPTDTDNNNQYQLTITATDKASLNDTLAVTVKVTDVNETPPIATGKLNDTGVTWGGNYPSGSNTTCTGVNIAGQDCSHGRDAQALAGTLAKVGAGRSGFDFTKLDASGNDLPALTTTWSCVRDNVTGLIWEVKTDDGGLHDADNTYTWYNTDSTDNGGNAGTQNGGTCPAGTGDCDTSGFVTAVNTATLCGANDWRLPEVEELRGIADKSKVDPAIDTDYFPRTKYLDYWSSSSGADVNGSAWVVYFNYGNSISKYMYLKSHVRLVRGGQ